MGSLYERFVLVHYASGLWNCFVVLTTAREEQLRSSRVESSISWKTCLTSTIFSFLFSLSLSLSLSLSYSLSLSLLLSLTLSYSLFLSLSLSYSLLLSLSLLLSYFLTPLLSLLLSLRSLSLFLSLSFSLSSHAQTCHRCTCAHLLPLFSDLSCAFDHTSNAFALAQVVPKKRVALDMVAERR